MVRVYNMNPIAGGAVSVFVQVEGSALVTLSNLQMGEFLFWVDDNVDPAVGRWIAVQKNTACSYLPAI